MPSQILISVNKNRISVAPGASVELQATVQNLTTLVDQIALSVDGIDPSWTRVIPPYLPVFAQGQATARIVITPPADLQQSVAGIYPLRVCGLSQQSPGEQGEAVSELEIQLVGDYRFGLDPGSLNDKQETTFGIKVQNRANGLLRFQLQGKDEDDRLWYKFDPFQLDIPAGSDGTGLLTIRPRQLGVQADSILFNVTAHADLISKDQSSLAASTRQVTGQYALQAVPHLNVTISPPQLELQQSGVFAVRVRNPGRVPVRAQLAATSDTSTLQLQIFPDELMLAPQSESTARLDVFARGVFAPGVHHSSIEVTATADDSQIVPVTAGALLTQTVPMPASQPVSRPIPWIMFALFVAGLFFTMSVLVILYYALGLG